MSGHNKLIIAAAGSGKTTFLVKEALSKSSSRILITTYTQSNEDEIRRKFIALNGCVPGNVKIQTWFSFLIQHGVKPYQGCKFVGEINGLILINGQSAQGVTELRTREHYLTAGGKIYSDKLSKFVVKCNERSEGAVVDRLSRIYTHIFIDEVQDLAGYDLDFLKLLFECSSDVLMVGDPRQGTYSTNNSSKNSRFKKSRILNFFEENFAAIEKDETSLTVNYRSCQEICDLSNSLYNDLPKTTSGSKALAEHHGVYLVKKSHLKNYLSAFKPMQLRDSIKTQDVSVDHPVTTFGKSKGLEFERVVIYPTTPFIKWLKGDDLALKTTSRSKFYVAVTRARHSVGIVCDDDLDIPGVKNFVLVDALNDENGDEDA